MGKKKKMDLWVISQEQQQQKQRKHPEALRPTCEILPEENTGVRKDFSQWDTKTQTTK